MRYAEGMDTPDSAPRATSDRVMPPAEMVAQHLCPLCGERATLRCATCERFFCAEHVSRGFELGYAFVCVECMATQE